MRQLRTGGMLLAVAGAVAWSMLVAVGCKGPRPPAEAPRAPRPTPVASDAAGPAPAPEGATATGNADAAESPRGGRQRPGPDARMSMERTRFNVLAAQLAEPLFWRADDDLDGALDVEELALLTLPLQASKLDYVRRGRFSPGFELATRRIRQLDKDGYPAADPATEQPRLDLVLRELGQGQPTLVFTDLRQAPAPDRALAEAMIEVAQLIELLHARQNGTLGMERAIPAHDRASKALFARNQGPWCEAPQTEAEPACNALASMPKRVSGLYPAELQTDPDFCAKLAGDKDGETLMAPLVIVVKDGDALKAVPYHVAWPDEHEAIARALIRAADAQGEAERALVAYLRAAAVAFRTGDWFGADAAWAAMNAENSKWYLRVGPDETYFEPCSRKAGYHVSFARIDQDVLGWKRKLEALRTAMETEVARLTAKPYAAREVGFALPEGIQIVLNAGDSRSAHGATVGQSLPNFGPVAAESRGRTVAMTNLYRDPDSIATRRAQLSSILCAAAADRAKDDVADAAVLGTILHEAAHNLGPNGSWKVGGKTDDAVFGGTLAATLEELKAQTLAIHLNLWLVGQGKLDAALSEAAWMHDIVWTFGHIAAGMRTAEGKAKPYPQLAAVQVGRLLAAGALRWDAEALAANGNDKGCLDVDPAKLPTAIAALATDVLAIKAKGDVRGGSRLLAPWVDDSGKIGPLRATIRERWLRAPKASFVYSVAL